MTTAFTHEYGHFDVLIVGGGVIGLAAARELRKKGVERIGIAEAGEISREASYAAAGMLGPQAESDADDAFFRFCLESNALFDVFAAELLDETGVDIELDRTGTLSLAFDETAQACALERAQWQTAAGLSVEVLSADDVRRREPSISREVRSGLFFANDGQVENRCLIGALRRFCELNDIVLLEGRPVRSIATQGGSAVAVETNGGEISADSILLATGAWTSLIDIPDSPMPIDVRPIRGQMISFASKQSLLTHVVYGRDIYLVPRADGRILAGSTVESVGFEKGVTVDAVEFLRRGAAHTVPALGLQSVVESWSGLRPFSPDGLPVLGAVEGCDRLYVATAHYRNGILLSPLTAKIMAQSITAGRASKYIDYFGMQRFRPTKTACVI